MRPLLAFDAAKTMAASVVGSELDYCNSVPYGMSQANLDRLQRVQNVSLNPLRNVIKLDFSGLSISGLDNNVHVGAVY